MDLVLKISILFMKIIYDDIIYSLQKSGGGSVYWTEIIKPTLREAEHYVYNTAKENIFYNQIAIANEHRLSSRGLIIKRFINPKYGIKIPYIFHSSYFRYSRDRKAINITTIHDFTIEKFGRNMHSAAHILQQKLAVKHSLGVICVSKNTKKDFEEYYPWYNGKVIIIPNGYDENTYFVEPGIKKTKDILFVGSRADYKRFDIAVKIVAELSDCNLVIVGGGRLSNMERTLLESILPGRFKKMGFIDNDELRHLYNRAFFLCYPSEYEGFGIPLLEAQACGCPVLCQKKSSIPEVVKDTALYFDNQNIKGAIDLVKSLYDKDIYLEYQKRGLYNVKGFLWETSARKHQDFYQEMWMTFNK